MALWIIPVAVGGFMIGHYVGYKKGEADGWHRGYIEASKRYIERMVFGAWN